MRGCFEILGKSLEGYEGLFEFWENPPRGMRGCLNFGGKLLRGMRVIMENHSMSSRINEDS
jgi:hypothetical protein